MSSIKKARITAVVIFLTCGTISTMAVKLMSTQEVDEGAVHRKFFHPYMQALVMFVGQSLWLLLFMRKKDKQKLEGGKTPHTSMIFIIPAFSDAFSSCLQYMALNFISGSTFLMFKGCSIVTTAIFSKILFGMVLQARHFIGCGSAIIGLIIVGSSEYLEPSSDAAHLNNEALGYILMLISLVFNGFLYAYEQFLMRKHTIDPLQMIGCEGCFGIIIITFILLIFNFLPCHLSPKVCVFDKNGNPYFQRTDIFFQEVLTNGVLFILVILGMVTLSLYNLNGVKITKLFDALTRSLLNITKTGLIWLVGIFLTLALGENPDYVLQSKNGSVNFVKAIGFGCIVTGTLVYNKLIFKSYFADKDTAIDPGHIHLQQEKQNQERVIKEIQMSTS